MGSGMKLSLARQELAAICSTALPVEWGVVDHLPDSVAPPMVLVAWGDPWMKPSTMCAFESTMELMLIAQRIEPGGKLETLEDGVSTLLPALKSSDFTLIDTTAPYPMQIAGVDYLACSINLNYEVGD